MLASNEEPFPSITEIAKRLGYTSSTLYRYFPAMCHAITRKSHRVIDLNDVRQELVVILAQQDGLLPSLKEIGKRVNYPETSLRRHFPEFCRAIVERRRNGLLREFPLPEVQPERWFTEEDWSAGKQKKREDLDEAQKALEKVLDGDSYPSMIEVAQQLGFSASSLYHYFPVLCRTIAMRHKQQQDRELQHLKSALEEVLASDQRPYTTMQEVAKRLKCNDMILYDHFPELCYAIAKRHRPNLSLLQQSLEAILESAEIPPSISETACRLGCSAAILRYYFPDHCKAIIERHRRLNELETQRQALAAVAASEQATLSVNEIGRHLGCSSSVLYARFPELCQAITERRWSLSNKDELRQALEAALMEEPPTTFQEVARRLDCPPKNIEYYYPDLCKAIARRYREATNVSELQKALEAFLALEEPPSLSEAARFRMPEAREALREVLNELGYEW